MKKMFWIAGGLCAAAAGFIMWSKQQRAPVDELAHRLEAAWADHHTVV